MKKIHPANRWPHGRYQCYRVSGGRVSGGADVADSAEESLAVLRVLADPTYI